MNIVRIKTYWAGKYDYINTDMIEYIRIEDDHYDVHMSAGEVICVALDDPTISGYISASVAAYTGA